MYINQLVLNEKQKIGRNRFLRSMLSCADFQKPHLEFSVLRQSIYREPESEMTIRAYCDGYARSKETHTVLLIGSRNPFLIVYGTAFFDGNGRHHMTLDMPFQELNLERVSRLYCAAFKSRLEDEPVPDWLPAHHEHLRRRYPRDDPRCEDASSFPPEFRNQR